MKLQLNNATLLQVDNELLRFKQMFPLVFKMLLEERVNKYRQNNMARIQSAYDKPSAIATKYIQKDENGQFKKEGDNYIYNNELDKIQFDKEIEELNKLAFEVVI